MRHQHVSSSVTIHKARRKLDFSKVPTSEFVPYKEYPDKEYPVSARLPEISLGTLDRLSPDKVMINNRIYLYSSIFSPVRGETNMDAYMKKPAILADLEIPGEP